jgi:hypothetical protein
VFLKKSRPSTTGAENHSKDAPQATLHGATGNPTMVVVVNDVAEFSIKIHISWS